jgi:hypothetical protein
LMERRSDAGREEQPRWCITVSSIPHTMGQELLSVPSKSIARDFVYSQLWIILITFTRLGNGREAK